MAVLSITTDFAGQISVNPRLVRLSSTDTLATITAPGYLNNTSLQGFTILPTDIIFCALANNGKAILAPTISGGVISLSEAVPSIPSIPTTINDIAIFTNTLGSIGDGAAVTAAAGGLQAGFNGQAGIFTSFPAGAGLGTLQIFASNSAGNTITSITNVSMGQASAFILPDPGVANTKFIVADSAGTQTIATGNLTLTLGNLTLTAGNLTIGGAFIATGDIEAGSSGHAGKFISFPATAANGTLNLQAINAGAAFNSTISNSTMGQTTVFSLVDPGSATVNFILSKNAGTQHITSGNLQVDAGSLISGISTGGFVGALQLFPTTASRGSFIFSATANTGNTNTTITNTAMGQGSTITIPDPGAATANFILSAATTGQTIGTAITISGSNNLQVLAGNIIAGSSGNAGILAAFPATAARGRLLISAVNNTGNTDTTISNAAMGQATVISIPDPTAATANFILSASNTVQNITSGNFAVTNGTIISGQNGVQGQLTLFPSGAASGQFQIIPTNGANFVMTLTNASIGQASTISIPDPAAATATFIISTMASAQSITRSAGTGNTLAFIGDASGAGAAMDQLVIKAKTNNLLQLIMGVSQVTGQGGIQSIIQGTGGTTLFLNPAGGNVQVGTNNSGFGTSLYIYPSGNNVGAMILMPNNNSGNFTQVIQNAPFGQSSTLTIPDPVSATAKFVLDTGTTTMAATGQIIFQKANGTEAANAVTASGQAGVITTSALTTAGGGSYAITWTNTKISTTSSIQLQVMGGTNTTQNISLVATAGAGTSTLTIFNNTVATALNGTILIGYFIA